MLESVKVYVYERRNVVPKTATVLCSLYLVRRYIAERLEEVKEKLELERVARNK